MNLHTLPPAVTGVYAWQTPTGMRYRVLGPGTSHLYPIDRGRPPAMGNPMRSRRWWYPYSNLTRGDDALNALCGRIRSTSRNPHLTETDNGACPGCTLAAHRLGIMPDTISNLRRQDPWTQLNHDERETTPDPVSGL